MFPLQLLLIDLRFDGAMARGASARIDGRPRAGANVELTFKEAAMNHLTSTSCARSGQSLARSSHCWPPLSTHAGDWRMSRNDLTNDRNQPQATILTQSPLLYAGVIYVGTSSNEEHEATDTKYECCSFVGSLAAVDLRSRRDRAGARKRTARGLRRMRLVPAAGAERPSVAHNGPPRHDAAYFRDLAFGAGALSRGRARDSRMLVREATDPERISHCRRGQAGWRGRACV